MNSKEILTLWDRTTMLNTMSEKIANEKEVANIALMVVRKKVVEYTKHGMNLYPAK